MSHDPSPAQIIGHYALLEELGRGGQGTVWLAEDRKLKRKVALKLLHAVGGVTEDRLHRFRREAEAASKLDHPNICGLLDAGEVDGTPYLAFRYVEGETLAERITRTFERREGYGASEDAAGVDPDPSNSQGIERIVALFEKTARALHKAHEQGLIHRDVKPSNLMITPDGEPVVLDFGLARDELAEEQSLTHSGDLLGTPSYMSPEQLVAQRIPLDRRTDVYSLGASLYEALTLQKPYAAPTRAELYQKILASDPSSASTLNRQIPRDLQVVLETAMEKDRNRRYQTALDFAEDLRRFREHESVRARPIGRLLRLKRWAQRHPGGATATAALFLLLVGSLVATLMHLATVQAERDRQRALALSSQAGEVVRRDSRRALDLALEAVDLDPANPTTASRLQEVLSAQHELRVFERHMLSVSSVAVSPTNKRLLLTASEDGTFKLWDLQSGMALWTEEIGEAVTSAMFSPDGGRIVTTSDDGTVRLWNLQGTSTKPSLTLLKTTIEAKPMWAEFSPKLDDDRIVIGDAEGSVWLWTPEGMQLVGQHLAPYPQALCNRVRFSPDGSRIVSASDDHTAIIWSLDDMEKVVLEGHTGWVGDAVFSPSGNRVVTAAGDRSLRIWDLGGNQLDVVRGKAGFRGACWSPDEQLILAASTDQLAHVYRQDGREFLSLAGHTDSVYCAIFGPNDGEILTSSRDGTVHLWEIEIDGFPIARVQGSVRPSVFSSDGTQIALASVSGAWIWNWESGRKTSLQRHPKAVRSIDWSDGRVLLAGFFDATMELWNPLKQELIGEFPKPVWPGKTGSVLSYERLRIIGAVLSPVDEGTAATAGADGTVLLWDLGQGTYKLLGLYERIPTAIRYSPNGELLAVALYGGDPPVGLVRVLDLGGRTVRQFQNPDADRAITTVDISGQHILTGSAIGKVRLLPIGGGAAIWDYRHEGPVSSVAFSPTGERIVSSSRDGTATIRRAADGKEILTIRSPDGFLLGATFSPDGRRVLTASADGVARLWFADPEEIIERAKMAARR